MANGTNCASSGPLHLGALQDVAVVVDVPLLPVLHVLHPKSTAVQLSFDVQEGV
jgi:hypothetical protein